MKLNYSQLEDMVNQIIDVPPGNEEEFDERRKYFNLALDEEQKAEAFLISAKKESELIGEYLRLEVELENAPAPEREQVRRELLRQEKRIRAAANATLLVSVAEDHRLRGNIRYLKNYLKNNG